MKKILLGAAAFVAWAFAVPASAAEIDGGPIPPDFFTAPPAFAPPRAYNWTGVYIGINAGGGWGNPHWDTSPWPSTLMDGNYSLSGGLFGGTLGYNLQAGTSSFVIGGEVDLAAANIKGRTPPFVAQVVSFPLGGPPIVTPTPGCLAELRSEQSAAGDRPAAVRLFIRLDHALRDRGRLDRPARGRHFRHPPGPAEREQSRLDRGRRRRDGDLGPVDREAGIPACRPQRLWLRHGLRKFKLNRSEREHRQGWRPYQRQREHHSRRAQFQDSGTDEHRSRFGFACRRLG